MGTERVDIMKKTVEEEARDLQLDEDVVRFLDADDLEKRYEILERLYPRITDDMIDICALAIDAHIEEGDLDERYNALRDSLKARLRYEAGRRG